MKENRGKNVIVVNGEGAKTLNNRKATNIGGPTLLNLNGYDVYVDKEQDTLIKLRNREAFMAERVDKK